MKAFYTAALVCALATPAFSQSFSDIMGKPLTNAAGTVTIKKNGTVSGTLNGQKLRLKWNSEDGKFCREGKLGTNDIPRKCQTVRIQGNQISFIDSDGSNSSTYTIGQ